MILSKLAEKFPITVIKDGTFDTLGLLSHVNRKMLVGFYDVSFVHKILGNPHISCVITSPKLAKHLPASLAVATCVDPKTGFYAIHDYLDCKTDFYWQDFTTQISPLANVHETAFIAPNNVKIGPGTVVGPNASILERSLIGENVVIQSGVVIGGAGMELKEVDGRYENTAHAGGVSISDRVGVSANSHIQRAVFSGMTEIGEDSQVGSLVTVGHHVKIGKRCEVGGGSVICGSSIIGDDVWVGPNSTISSELFIQKRARIHLGSVVVKDVSPGEQLSGIFALDSVKAMREFSRMKK